MKLFKKLTLSLSLLPLTASFESYGYSKAAWDKYYYLETDLMQSINNFKYVAMLPYNNLRRLYNLPPYNLSNITDYVTEPSTLLLLGGYYYYKLNQDYKAQQEIIKQLEQKLEEQDQAASNDSKEQIQDQADDAQDNA